MLVLLKCCCLNVEHVIIDGGVGGVCQAGSSCNDEDTVCIPDANHQCAGINCEPGTCECKPGYSVTLGNHICIQGNAVLSH